MSDQNPEKKSGFDSFKAVRVKVQYLGTCRCLRESKLFFSFPGEVFASQFVLFVCLFVFFVFVFLLSQLTCESPLTSHKNTILKYAASLYGEDLQWAKVTAF